MSITSGNFNLLNALLYKYLWLIQNWTGNLKPSDDLWLWKKFTLRNLIWWWLVNGMKKWFEQLGQRTETNLKKRKKKSAMSDCMTGLHQHPLTASCLTSSSSCSAAPAPPHSPPPHSRSSPPAGPSQPSVFWAGFRGVACQGLAGRRTSRQRAVGGKWKEIMIWKI